MRYGSDMPSEAEKEKEEDVMEYEGKAILWLLSLSFFAEKQSSLVSTAKPVRKAHPSDKQEFCCQHFGCHQYGEGTFGANGLQISCWKQITPRRAGKDLKGSDSLPIPQSVGDIGEDQEEGPPRLSKGFVDLCLSIGWISDK